MKCYIHNESEAVGTCVNCGKFICTVCNTEINGKNFCKACVSEVFENLKKENESKRETPMVFMNAGGGASSSSASSSSAASSGRGRIRHKQGCLTHIILLIFTGGIGNIIYFLWARNKYYYV